MSATLRRSLPLQGPHRADTRWRTGFLLQSLCLQLGLRRLGWQAHPLSPLRERSRKSHVERGSLLLTLCLAGLSVACSWSCAGPLVARTSVDNPLSTYACALFTSSPCMAPDLSADHFKGDGSLPTWTSGKRVCAIGRSVDRLRTGSRARGRAAYTPNVPRLHTNSFKSSACGQAASEERL